MSGAHCCNLQYIIIIDVNIWLFCKRQKMKRKRLNWTDICFNLF